MHSRTYSVPSIGASLRVREAEADGTPMILVHGGPGGTDYLFKFLARQLADAGYKAVGFIQRGSQGSPSDGPFTIQAFAEDVEAVRDHLGAGRIGILGHSWGGLLTTIYASQHPEVIERLILVCPIGPRSGWRKQFNDEIRARLPHDLREEFDHLKFQAAKAHSREEAAPLLVRRANIAVASYFSPRHREGKPGLAFLDPHIREAVLRQLEGWYADPYWEQGLRRLRCPCTVIYGKDDPIPEYVAHQYADLFPEVHLAGIDHCGHFPWMEEVDRFHALLDEALRRPR
ncbi:MAG: alpha/beta hydrolase [Candidatus Sumerlaeia bacterium]|nr:alpha/beta hydrolase [Candidatus Sumerlaeia bacterium]